MCRSRLLTTLLMEILRYGADVQVLAPDSLRSRVAESLRRAADRYAGG